MKSFLALQGAMLLVNNVVTKKKKNSNNHIGNSKPKDNLSEKITTMAGAILRKKKCYHMNLLSYRPHCLVKSKKIVFTIKNKALLYIMNLYSCGQCESQFKPLSHGNASLRWSRDYRLRVDSP